MSDRSKFRRRIAEFEKSISERYGKGVLLGFGYGALAAIFIIAGVVSGLGLYYSYPKYYTLASGAIDWMRLSGHSLMIGAGLSALGLLGYSFVKR